MEGQPDPVVVVDIVLTRHCGVVLGVQLDDSKVFRKEPILIKVSARVGEVMISR